MRVTALRTRRAVASARSIRLKPSRSPGSKMSLWRNRHAATAVPNRALPWLHRKNGNQVGNSGAPKRADESHCLPLDREAHDITRQHCFAALVILSPQMTIAPPAEAHTHASPAFVLASKQLTCATTRIHWRPRRVTPRRALIAPPPTPPSPRPKIGSLLSRRVIAFMDGLRFRGRSCPIKANSSPRPRTSYHASRNALADRRRSSD